MSSAPERLDDATMSFGDHLEELRRRILIAGAPAVPLAIVFFAFSEPIIRLLVRPLKQVLAEKGLPPHLQALAPPEVLLIQLKLGVILALVVLAPWIMWQAWLFVRPGLYAEEQRFVRFLVPGSALLTAAGVSLFYFVMLPLMLTVLVGVGSRLDLGDVEAPATPEIRALIDAGLEVPIRTRPPDPLVAGQAWIAWPTMELCVAIEAVDGTTRIEVVPDLPRAGIQQTYRLSIYVNFVLLVLLGMVVAFQMPLVIVLLGWLGLASPTWLRRQRRYAVFACGVLSALLTPADIVSMVAMLLPLYGLYELGILLLWLAPAGAVAEGDVLRRAGRRARPGGGPSPPDPDKQEGDAGQPAKPAQPESTVPRSPDGTGPRDEPPTDAADEREDRG